MTRYMERDQWTSTPASGQLLVGGPKRGVAVHWPGTSQDRIGDPGSSVIAQRLRHYRDLHVNVNGWRDIGYNLAIDQGGRVWMLRSQTWPGNLVGAHCASSSNPTANRDYVGVLLLLGDQEPLSHAMIAAFRDWYQERFLTGWPNRLDVRGHGQVAGAATECPGPFARAVMHDLTVPNPEDDMFTDADRAKLNRIEQRVGKIEGFHTPASWASSTAAVLAKEQGITYMPTLRRLVEWIWVQTHPSRRT